MYIIIRHLTLRASGSLDPAVALYFAYGSFPKQGYPNIDPKDYIPYCGDPRNGMSNCWKKISINPHNPMQMFRGPYLRPALPGFRGQPKSTALPGPSNVVPFWVWYGFWEALNPNP